MTVVSRTIVQIDDIDLLEFAPLHSLSVQFCNPIRREVSDFYLDVVFSRFQELSYLKLIRYCPYTACFLSVDPDTGTFADIS